MQKEYFRYSEKERDLGYENPANPLTHKLKKNKRRYLKVRSVQKYDSQKKYSRELKPLGRSDVERMMEEDIQVKFCDMGNACYFDNHYSDIIQTREYRSPEVIMGGEYDETADIWSMGCMIFEFVTGEYLFNPKKGKTYRKNDDHLAQISELIGPCRDFNWLQTNPKVWKFYDRKKKTPHLKNISRLKEWPLYNVLLEKYRLKDSEARSFTSFISKMIQWKPKDRASAKELLDHPWLKERDDYDVWMSKNHLNEFRLVNIQKFPEYKKKLLDEKMEE